MWNTFDPKDNLQLDPGSVGLTQGGNDVGAAFCEPIAGSSDRYVEHWVLFEGRFSSPRMNGNTPNNPLNIKAIKGRNNDFGSWVNATQFKNSLRTYAADNNLTVRYIRCERTDTNGIPY